MDCLISEITKLTDDWRSLSGKGHCKDKDFHWYIETKWSYGLPPVYIVQHNGYILHDFEDIECSSYEDALKTLKEILIEKIEEEKKFIEERNDEDEW
jgi:hypothetical protein